MRGIDFFLKGVVRTEFWKISGGVIFRVGVDFGSRKSVVVFQNVNTDFRAGHDFSKSLSVFALPILLSARYENLSTVKLSFCLLEQAPQGFIQKYMAKIRHRNPLKAVLTAPSVLKCPPSATKARKLAKSRPPDPF